MAHDMKKKKTSVDKLKLVNSESIFLKCAEFVVYELQVFDFVWLQLVTKLHCFKTVFYLSQSSLAFFGVFKLVFLSKTVHRF